jgi:hypothetical protein
MPVPLMGGCGTANKKERAGGPALVIGLEPKPELDFSCGRYAHCSAKASFLMPAAPFSADRPQIPEPAS